MNLLVQDNVRIRNMNLNSTRDTNVTINCDTRLSPDTFWNLDLVLSESELLKLSDETHILILRGRLLCSYQTIINLNTLYRKQGIADGSLPPVTVLMSNKQRKTMSILHGI